MIGAIIGDIIGSPYEGRRMKFFDYDFPLFNERSTFTDDTILTIATAKSILENTSYKDNYLELGRKYRHKGYGSAFQLWLYSNDPQPYNSWGNGSAMRISPIGFHMAGYADGHECYPEEVEASASVTHNHPDAISGAQALTYAIMRAIEGDKKEVIKDNVSRTFGYEFKYDWQFYRDNYRFELKCKETVIQAMTAFFESNSFEDCIRKAVLMGGDTDTLACISGSLAEAYYKHISDDISMEALKRVPEEFIIVIRDFYRSMKVKI